MQEMQEMQVPPKKNMMIVGSVSIKFSESLAFLAYGLKMASKLGEITSEKLPEKLVILCTTFN